MYAIWSVAGWIAGILYGGLCLLVLIFHIGEQINKHGLFSGLLRGVTVGAGMFAFGLFLSYLLYNLVLWIYRVMP